MIKPITILNISEDIFECCPEAQLKTLFPILEDILPQDSSSKQAENKESKKIKFSEGDLHNVTKICRLIMSKLTVTHDLQFRGTLLRFLARTLPLTHPSGKNQIKAMDGKSKLKLSMAATTETLNS